jgi:site-specific recombinase XerD
MSRPHFLLPAFAKDYLREAPLRFTRCVVVLFHGWLSRNQRSLRVLAAKDIRDFMERPAGGKALSRDTAMNYLGQLRRYLKWLEVRGLSNPIPLGEIVRAYYKPYQQKRERMPVPDELRRYLEFIAPTRRPGTVEGFRSTLRQFHEWLEKQGVKLSDVDRPRCLGWFQHLHDIGLHPSTRVSRIACLRKYLDWLWEEHALKLPGRELIRAADFPRVPDYLPRPLSAEMDNQLQSRLRDSSSSLALGLFLMRRTGLRIGELRHLERECVRADHNGKHFLKVPLGKLHNERLVPLDEAALVAVTELQRRAPQTSPWLLENPWGRPIRAEAYTQVLLALAGDLPVSGRLTPHRLRHTFATSLLNGGMSLMGIMKLLGHRDYRMTLRYTRISDETLGREYFESLTRVAERYDLFRSESSEEQPQDDPKQFLQNAIRWVNKNLRTGSSTRESKLLARRLEAARDELERLRKTLPTPQK